MMEVTVCDFQDQVIEGVGASLLFYPLDHLLGEASYHVTKTLKRPSGETLVVEN